MKDYQEKFVKLPDGLHYEDVNDRTHETEFSNVKPLVEFYFVNDEPILAYYTLKMFGIIFYPLTYV